MAKALIPNLKNHMNSAETSELTPKRKIKLPQLSTEFTSVMFSAMILMTQDNQAFMSLVPNLLVAPGTKDFMTMIESLLKKNLDQAINLVCLLGLAEKLIKQENSARSTVSLIYFGYRIVFNQTNEELNKKDSQKLWSDVWSFAVQIPKIQLEIKEKEKIGDLHGWQTDVQNFARRRWRTLKNEQVPRMKEEIGELQKNINTFFKFDSDLKS